MFGTSIGSFYTLGMETIHIKAGVMSPVTFFVTTCVSLPEFMRRMSGSISVRKGETHYQKSVDIKKEGILKGEQNL